MIFQRKAQIELTCSFGVLADFFESVPVLACSTTITVQSGTIMLHDRLQLSHVQTPPSQEKTSGDYQAPPPWLCRVSSTLYTHCTLPNETTGHLKDLINDLI